MLHASTAHLPTVSRPGRPVRAPKITPRELTVLSLVVDGLTNPQIAERLSNSPRTVQSHVRSMMLKFAVQTRTQLAVMALRDGFVPLHPADGAGAEPLPIAA